MVEVHEVGQRVHAHPRNRLARRGAAAQRRQDLGIGEELRVAGEAYPRRRQARIGVRLDARVAIPAVDAVVADVVLVAEGDGLGHDTLQAQLRTHAGCGIGDEAERAQPDREDDELHGELGPLSEHLGHGESGQVAFLNASIAGPGSVPPCGSLVGDALFFVPYRLLAGGVRTGAW